ncbi:hypothetical protein LLE49_07740 [Alicyclobacillus tolerans]|uniref:hypothetical protein n=1 Tax=Alicyclobacillus tolerans TaxID=90970 RepID=UPI001F366376|nr:hypothetical protein [Alicyclobacillus tolerans]MCF8564636.1 hypothetical protein [Alicyclobacillus tolerans]
MSLKGSEREFIFSVYLRQRKRIVENVLGVRLTDLLLEEYWKMDELNKFKFDLFGYDRRLGVPAILEVWLGRSNGFHQERLLDLMEMLDEAILVYLAFSFQDKHVVELENKAKMCNKPIKLVLVEVNQEVLELLERLNAMHKLRIYGALDSLDEVSSPLRVIRVIENPLYPFLRRRSIPNPHHFDLEKREDINRYLLYRLREVVPNFLALQREKHFTDENPTIRLGAGKTGIDYYISAKNGRNLAFCELRFEEPHMELFNLFSMKPWLLRQQIDERVQVKDNAIGCYFKPYPAIAETTDELARIFSRMVNTISYPLYEILQFEHQMV